MDESEGARKMDDGKKEEGLRDLEKGEVGKNEVVDDDDDDDDDEDVENVAHGHGHHDDHEGFNVSRFHRLNPTNPLRIVMNSNTRVAKPPPPKKSQRSHTPTRSIPIPTPAPIQTPQPPPPPQQPVCQFFLVF